MYVLKQFLFFKFHLYPTELIVCEDSAESHPEYTATTGGDIMRVL